MSVVAGLSVLTKYWPAVAIALVLAIDVGQTARLHHAKADLAACRASRAAEEAGWKAVAAQGLKDTAAAQAAVQAQADALRTAKQKAAAIMRARPGSPADCAVARQVIQDALK